MIEKLESCPKCGAEFGQAEYDEQFCRGCGWRYGYVMVTVSSQDAARAIERKQRDLTFMIRRLCELRRDRFTGRLVIEFRDGKAVKCGIKPG